MSISGRLPGGRITREMMDERTNIQYDKSIVDITTNEKENDKLFEFIVKH